ncbi:NADH dehydrogenase subunit A [Longilinea arvoryzae]|uniref:NADH-quinone oxidoreductase subunit A n=1 Tax=Longilinea arvoryzae TaxID=360412 RepID=A0A0S7BJF4_9CHLR|nr:NADH-quinone oxidoreductase subunit A [Longilinea arvoryzae]GAP15901.1 NADH dehydrogenase subunit A [Longilinea arvoryzae]
MLQAYLPLLILLVLAVIIGLFVVLLGEWFGPKRPTARKSAPYESGMVPYGPGTRRISVRYYLVAVLFILFDIETVFFLLWAVVLRNLGVLGLIEMVVFISTLIVGFVYAWKKGALEWE